MSQAFPDRNHVKTNKTPQKWIFSVRNQSDPNLWIRTQVPNRVTQTPLTQQNQGFRVLTLGDHVGLLSAYQVKLGFKVSI